MITLTSADSALKNVYLGVLANQLNTGSNPLLTRIERTSQNVVGREIHKLIGVGINGGIGAGSEDGNLPLSAQNKYATFKTTLKNLYGKIEISDKAIRASSGEAGAFVNLLEAEMQGLIESSKFHLGRMLYGNGTGILGIFSNGEEGKYDLLMDGELNNFMVGMCIDVYNDGVLDPDVSGARIVNWDLDEKTITLDKPITAAMMASNNCYLYVQGSKDREITGVGALFDPNITTLYGIDRSSNEFMTPGTKSLSMGDVTEGDMLAITDDLALNYNSEVDFIVCSYGVRRSYQKTLSATRMNIDTANIEGGFTALTFNGMPVVADRFVAPREMYFLNTKSFTLHQMCDWEWLTNDKGQILRQKEGYPIHTATLVKYAELMCSLPAGQFKLINIAMW